MTPLSPSEQERHRETTAIPIPDHPHPPPPPQGSAPSKIHQRPAVASATMSGPGGSSSGAERARAEGRLAGVVSGMTALLLAVVVAGMDAAVTRKKRAPRVRAETSQWRSFSLPVPPPPPAATPGKCSDCKVTQTSQWRTGPKGRRTLCDTCGRRRWAAGQRWGDPRRCRQEMMTPTPPPTTVADQPPPPPPPADGPIFEGPSLPDGYRAARKNAAAKRRSPSPAPETATTDSVDKPAPQIKKRKKYKYKARTDKQCVHCGSSQTPQWRKGPEGRATLCNACGVRHRQSRLLPEYRPQASPTFDKENHASLHSEVLALRRQKNQKKQKEKQQPPSAVAQPHPMDHTQQQVVHLMPPPLPRCIASNLRVGATGSALANNASSSAAGQSTIPVRQARYYLHPFLLNGPAAPMIVDEPYWMVAGPPAP